MKIDKCRVCGNQNLTDIINLGYQKYTGVFPKDENEDIGGGELSLVKCCGERTCGLVQLKESFDPDKMYGETYGYHSSLNRSMVDHLGDITREIKMRIDLKKDDLIVDIGSNDGTLLGTYFEGGETIYDLVGIDPSGHKFKEYYKKGIVLIEDFFSAGALKKVRPEKKARVITSIAMFYDLEDPVTFAKDVASVLDENGIWVIEQSYLPSMVKTVSYDTICHEHIEFYTLKQIEFIAHEAGMKVVDVSLNETNGGSFRVTLAKSTSDIIPKKTVENLRAEEMITGVNEPDFFNSFYDCIIHHKSELVSFLKQQKQDNKLVLGYGASTKGNVVLQYCNIGKDVLPAIVEVNSDKFGCYTPGSNIPIISEEEGKKMNPDYFLVLPWHFKNNILEKEKEYRKQTGVKFVFYLPKLEII